MNFGKKMAISNQTSSCWNPETEHPEGSKALFKPSALSLSLTKFASKNINLKCIKSL